MSQLVLGGIKQLTQRIESLRPKSTEWVTVEDISGTGTDVASSASMSILTPVDEPIVTAVVAVEFVHGGAPGRCQAAIRLFSYPAGLASTLNDASHKYTNWITASSTGQKKQIVIPLPLVTGVSSATTYDQRLSVRIEAKGLNETDEWYVENIRAQLRYLVAEAV